MTALMHEKLFIDGKWDEGSTGEQISVVNPATEEEIGQVPQASVGDVERAIRAAHTAFGDGRGVWPSMKPKDRSRLLHAFCDELDAQHEELVRLAIVEMGTSQAIAEASQVSGGTALMRQWADTAATFQFEEFLPVARGAANVGQTLVRKEPIGVVAAITPFNAPHLINMWKLAPALALGNTVVLKPSPYTPFSAVIVAKAAEKAGLPPGVVNIVTGDREAGELLTSHPLVDLVTFTGSDGVGRLIAAQAGSSLKRVVLELGGKSALVVFDDVDLDDPRIIGALVNGATSRAGQGCALTTRVLVESSIYDEVARRAVEALEKVKVGDPADATVKMGPLIRESQRARVENYIDIAKSEGAVLATGGKRPGHLDRGYFVEPTLFTGVRNDMRIAQEEVFGPVSVMIPFDGTEEAIAIANDSKFGLGGAVWSGNRRRAFEVADSLRTGTVNVNGGSGAGTSGPPPFGAPFGGYKHSGLGREHGAVGASEFLEYKTVSYPIG